MANLLRFRHETSAGTMLALIGGVLGIIILGITTWVFHVIACIKAGTAFAFGLLVLGIVIPPIGWIHGLLYMLGVV